MSTEAGRPVWERFSLCLVRAMWPVSSACQTWLCCVRVSLLPHLSTLSLSSSCDHSFRRLRVWSRTSGKCKLGRADTEAAATAPWVSTDILHFYTGLFHTRSLFMDVSSCRQRFSARDFGRFKVKAKLSVVRVHWSGKLSALLTAWKFSENLCLFAFCLWAVVA